MTRQWSDALVSSMAIVELELRYLMVIRLPTIKDKAPSAVDAPSREAEPRCTADELAAYWSSYPVPIEFNEDEECSVFPDGAAAAICTSWAKYVRRIYGKRAELFGFLDKGNPESAIAQAFGGHDFALLDGRFIVDGWLNDNDLMAATMNGRELRSVYDLECPADDDDIRALYGSRDKWVRGAPLEAAIDAEKPKTRARHMRGVSLEERAPGAQLSGPGPSP